MLNELKTAVILVGGNGTRLKPYTNNMPKPLIEIEGKSILEWNSKWLKSNGIENLVFGCGLKKDNIKKFMEERNNLGFKSVEYSENSVEGGTAEAFRLAITKYVKDENYLAMNGDELTNLDLNKMFKTHYKTKATVTMALVPFTCNYSVIEIDKSTGMVNDFVYGKTLEDVPVSIGIYLFNKRINNIIPNSGSIEDILFTKLSKNGEIAPHMLDKKEEWTTINDHKQKTEAGQTLKRWGLIKN